MVQRKERSRLLRIALLNVWVGVDVTVQTTRTARARNGTVRAPLSTTKKQQLRTENATAGGLLGGLIGLAGGPLGVVIGASVGAAIGQSLKPEQF
jgi:hypothetical protein